MEQASVTPSPALPLERSASQHSTTSIRSHRSATLRAARGRRLLSQPSSSTSSIAPSDKSLTSFPSFSPESPNAERFDRKASIDVGHGSGASHPDRGFQGRNASGSISGAQAGLYDARDVRSALFEDAPVMSAVPGALHRADDEHIERLIARHGAVQLVRQIAEDLARRDAQNATLRRRADERERALRRIIRECGLSNLDLETRLRTVEAEMRSSGAGQNYDEESGSLSHLMSDAMQDTMSQSVWGSLDAGESTIRASSTSSKAPAENGKGTFKGWKDYIWGSGTAKRSSRAASVNGANPKTSGALRSHSSLDRRPTLQDDLFSPPAAGSVRASSRASSVYSNPASERKPSASMASLALRLVAGGAMSGKEAEPRGRASSAAMRIESDRTNASASRKGSRSTSVAGGPKALMAMRRSTPAPQAPASTKAQAQELWGPMGSPPNQPDRQESYGPVEMEAILPPESQPPTLSHIYNNYANSEFLTDRFGFIYDQRRKKRQREAAAMARHARKGSRSSRTEMLMNSRTAGISPNMLEDLPSPKWSISSEGRPGSPSSLEDRLSQDEGRPKRWQEYLKIATFPTELLSHMPSMGPSTLEVLDAAEDQSETPAPTEPSRPPGITTTDSGLVPTASTTTAVDSESGSAAASNQEVAPKATFKEDTEPVKLLLEQLNDVHDSLQREKTVRWNDFLRKVRAERRRDGEAAVAAAAAAAEARFERPAMILPETRVADGEIIGISNLGHKGKVGRAKWNEFKNLVLGGIPVAYRAKVWSECSGAAALRVPGYYDDLVAKNESEEDDPAVTIQIQMDIHRTLTDNIFFRKGPGVQKLNEVLLAYARRNRDVGYCQGMNLIAANFLLITPSAEDAFWILTSIIENILPHAYYDQSLMASRADQQVLRQYVSEILPKLSAHLDTLSIELEALTFQWFLSVFTDCLCAEALFRVWDVVLCTNDGSTFLFQVALALLKLNEGNLLQCGTPAGIYTYINHQMTEHAISIDGLLQASEALRKVVKREEVEARRDRVIQAEKDLMAERNEAWIKSKRGGDETDSSDLALAEPQPME